MSIKEITEECGMSKSQVETILCRIRKQLRNWLIERKFYVGNISDEYLLEALSYCERKKMVKNFSKAAAAILLAIIITGLSLNVFMPIYARNLPFVGNAFAFIQDRLHTGGAYSNYAFKIGDKVTDNGITMTMSEDTAMVLIYM